MLQVSDSAHAIPKQTSYELWHALNVLLNTLQQTLLSPPPPSSGVPRPDGSGYDTGPDA